MRQGRFITTAVAAVAVMAIGPAWASAAPSPLTDDVTTDFAAGTAGPTRGPSSRVSCGSSQLAGRELRRPSSRGPDRDAVDPGGGSRDGGRREPDRRRRSRHDGNAPRPSPRRRPWSSARTFGGDAIPARRLRQHVQRRTLGDLQHRRQRTAGCLYARTLASTAGPRRPRDPAISGVDPLAPHTYRIDWSNDRRASSTSTTRSVATHALRADRSPDATRWPAIFTPVGPGVKVDWLAMGSSPSTGTFVSRVLAADDPHTVWGALTSVGSGADFETRTGNTATPDAPPGLTGSRSGRPGRSRVRAGGRTSSTGRS